MTTALLLCNDPLRPPRTDPHFAEQATAARQLGFSTALLDHDALLAGRPDEAVRRVPQGLGPVWYRGWMIPADDYAALAEALATRGAQLLTDPGQYRSAHELPGWYPEFRAVTPASEWLACPPSQTPEADALAGAASRLPAGPGIVKDYVKSRKHDWDEACYLPDLGDAPTVHAVVARFIELQEDSLAGGIVLRAFEEFRREAGEARVWWLDGEAVLITAHPDTPELRPAPEIAQLAPLVRGLGCRFVTTDLAQRTDGVWRVIEVGDGQVSGLPSAIDPAALLGPLLGAPDATG